MSTQSERGFDPRVIARSVLAGTAIALTGIGGTYGFLHNWQIENPSNILMAGKVLPGTQKETYVTDPYGKISEIPVRNAPNITDKSQIGYTKAGEEVVGQAVFGVVYPSTQYLGNFDYNGTRYGVWYKIEDVPLYKKNEATGSLEPVFDSTGKQKRVPGYIAGNFLRKD